MKKIGVLLLTLLVVAIFGSCSKDDDVSVTGISLSPKTLTLWPKGDCPWRADAAA